MVTGGKKGGKRAKRIAKKISRNRAGAIERGLQFISLAARYLDGLAVTFVDSDDFLTPGYNECGPPTGSFVCVFLFVYFSFTCICMQ